MSVGQAKVLAPSRVLYRLFLTLFLRGSSARGLRRSSAPQSIASKLGWTLLIYFFMGGTTLVAATQGAFVLCVVQHALTHGVDHRPVPPHQHLKGRLVARFQEAVEQFMVGRFPARLLSDQPA